MNLDNINGSSPGRQAQTDGINKSRPSEPLNKTTYSVDTLAVKSDEIQISSHKYLNDLDFSRGVYDKLEAASLKSLTRIKAKYSDGLHDTNAVQKNISETLTRGFTLERLRDEVLKSPAQTLSPERQDHLLQDEEVLQATVNELLKSLKSM